MIKLGSRQEVGGGRRCITISAAGIREMKQQTITAPQKWEGGSTNHDSRREIGAITLIVSGIVGIIVGITEQSVEPFVVLSVEPLVVSSVS